MPTRSGCSSLNEDSRRVLNLTLGLWRTLAVFKGAMCEARDERGAMGGSGYTRRGLTMPACWIPGTPLVCCSFPRWGRLQSVQWQLADGYSKWLWLLWCEWAIMMVRVWCYRAAACGTCVSDVESSTSTIPAQKRQTPRVRLGC